MSDGRAQRATDIGVTAAALALVSTYTVVASGILWSVEGLSTPIRVTLALPVLLLTPGYAVVTALLPPTAKSPDSGVLGTGRGRDRERITTLERLTLALVTSIVVVGGVGLVANAVVGIGLAPVLAGVTEVTLVAAIVAVARIGGVTTSGGDGVRARWRRWTDGGLSVPGDWLTVATAAIVLLLLGSTAAVSLSDGGAGEPRTEFYLADGATPTDAAAGADHTYALTIEQHASSPQQYTLVVVAGSGADRRAVARRSTVVRPDEPTTERVRVGADASGNDTTVRVLLYTGRAPSDPDPATAHRTLRIRLGGGE